MRTYRSLARNSGGGKHRSRALVVPGKDEGFGGHGRAAEAFAECLVSGGRLPGQSGDLRYGLVVRRGPSRRDNRRSPTRVMATAAAVAVNQAIIQATEAPRTAITVIQRALATQHAPAASIGRDRPAAPTAGQGSGTDSAPEARGSAVIAAAPRLCAPGALG